MKNNKRMNIIITSFVMVLVLIGGTLAYLSWQSNEEQKTKIVFTINDGFECAADGGGDITNNDVMLAPASCTNSKYAIQREVIVSPTITNSSLAVTMDLWLNIDNLGTGLSESENFKYALTTSPTSCDGTEGKVISSGNFNGLVEGDQVALFDEKIYRKSMNDKYYLYVWLDTEETSSATQNQTFSLSLGGTCARSLKVEEPVLDEGMVPVTISDTGKVTTISSDDGAWYNYEKQKWANIVLVNKTATEGMEGSYSREYYLNNPGTEVLESDILAYYVWIPRYKYKIWTMGVSSAGNEQPIDIVFELNDAPVSLGTNVDEYRTHPAFWWDNDNDAVQDEGEMLPGIWVGKFETTGDETTPTVKPNMSSLVNQTVSTQFTTALKFAGGSMNNSTGEVTFIGNDTYGLTDVTDSHMMKNSEWGAAAYLSHSQYGINEEIRINNYYNSTTKTGCGALTENEATATTCGIPYGTPSTETHTYPQSTTGNITGVFDMSGGVWDAVMGNYNKTTGSSGFTLYPVSKYYDNYTTEDVSTACNGGICYGHALNETNGWYGDTATFLSSEKTWFYRGGKYSNTTVVGNFNYSTDKGPSSANYTFRSVLILKKVES